MRACVAACVRVCARVCLRARVCVFVGAPVHALALHRQWAVYPALGSIAGSGAAHPALGLRAGTGGDEYATRESGSRIKTFKNFKEKVKPRLGRRG